MLRVIYLSNKFPEIIEKLIKIPEFDKKKFPNSINLSVCSVVIFKRYIKASIFVFFCLY